MIDAPVKVMVAVDSFKGTCAAADATAAMVAGVRAVLGPSADVLGCPLADGGGGTLDALVTALDLEVREVPTFDSIGRPRIARVGLASDWSLGILDAAEANGLPLVSDVPPQPLLANIYGVGLLARELLDEGVREILLCIGGSASNDGGTGFLSALGVRFVDGAGTEVPLGAAGLHRIDTADLSGLHARVAEVPIRIAVDVDNPLVGPIGAAAVFGPQKGATNSDIAITEAGLAHLARVVEDATGVDVAATPGLGAAGGLPACLVGFAHAELVPGAQLVKEVVGFEALRDGADLVLTGEGSFDAQSLRGKVVAGVVAAVARRCPVVVVAGRVALSPRELRAAGVTAAWSIAPGPASMNDLARSTPDLIHDSAAHVAALFLASRGTASAPAFDRKTGER